MIELRLSWPPKELSPNGKHGHWAPRSRAKKEYRATCFFEAVGQRPFGDFVVPDGPLHIELVFHRATRRRFDVDNLVARMKSGLDGVTQALRIDDSRFASKTARLEERHHEDWLRQGRVLVRITAAKPAEATS